MKLINREQKSTTTDLQFKAILDKTLPSNKITLVWDIYNLIKSNTNVKLEIPNIIYLNNIIYLSWIKEDIYYLQCNIIDENNIQFVYLNKFAEVLEFTNYERKQLTKNTLNRNNLLFINEILNVRNIVNTKTNMLDSQIL